jgi:hypothetical protein
MDEAGELIIMSPGTPRNAAVSRPASLIQETYNVKNVPNFLTPMIMEKLRAKLQGHYNYYGVSGNCDRLSAFYHQTCMITFKWLNRRSQRKSCNWQGFGEMLSYYRIPQPKIIGYWS